MKRLAAVLVTAALGAAIALAQQPYFETFEVRLHNLDVVVTDAQGKPVHGLTKDDFVILEDGVQQNVTNFSVYDSGSSTASSVRTAPENVPAAATEKPPARRLVFFVDDMAVQNGARATLLRQATKLVDEMREGDLGAVIRPTGTRIAQDFTTDSAKVRQALADAIKSTRIRGDAPGLFELRELQNAMERADTPGDRLHAKGVYAGRVRQRVQQRLAQLRARVGSLAGVEGRKVLVVITAGLPVNPGRDAIDFMDQIGGGEERLVKEWGERGGDFSAPIDDLARTAAANGVTIYALEPEVPLATGVHKSAASKTTGSTMGARGVVDPRIKLKGGGNEVSGSEIMPQQMLYELLHYRGRTLTSLTEKTGGKWFRGVATVDDLFRQVASDMRIYYSLAYKATGTRNKPRRVEVRIRNRPDLRARTRSEVVDRSPEQEMGDLTTANLLFPRDLNELRIAVESGPPAADGRMFRVPIDVIIPLDTLTFAPAADSSKYVATVDIHYAASAESNDFTLAGKHRQTIEIPADQHAGRAGVTYRFKTGLRVPPGQSRIAIGVMDSVSRLAGFRNLDLVAR